ncbi:MAG: ribbon-helix-helix protein, CopG family [Acidobacteria bacterium]|nr:ribbon-helix-helix protein, CopG family [Acidobacteriota bacterium]
MTTRKTFSLSDDLARALEREAESQGRPESALVREGMQQYLASLSTSKLARWVGKGRSQEPLDHESLHEGLVDILEKKHRRLRPRAESTD